MEVDTPVTTTPTARATNAPRTGPSPAPRTVVATTSATAPETTPPPVPATAPAAVLQAAPRGGTRPPSHPSRTLETLRCPICRRPHRLHHCGIFRGMRPVQRQQVAQAHGHCRNCLSHTHVTAACEPRGLCQICHSPHHTLLHRSAARELTRPAIQHGRIPRFQPASRGAPQRSGTSLRRRQPGPPPRRSTGLSSVVATLQQLQRLLG
ncbi:uncharacterized protein LOC120779898 [Bactrocera tryoni]|uniref:uncharacterized protein LOC120779898 n=1 Tax=Bactrocera tryoni TaxID=59916 RepID=UPI001A96BDA6|nr:uncharacterized protein LOC120779898 [Bactrocera tryoni]